MDILKQCSKCNNNKLNDCFYSDKSKKDKLSSRCIICTIESSKLRASLKKEEIKKYKEQYYLDNKVELNIKMKQNYKNNKEQYRIRSKKYNLEHKETLLIKRRIWVKNKLQTDILYKLTCMLRKRTRSVIKNKKFIKDQHFKEYLGCSSIELKIHLEKQFQPGMTWDNYNFNGWHIDHIIPLSSAKSEEELYKLCHYTNLQPLWALDNIKKSNKCQ